MLNTGDDTQFCFVFFKMCIVIRPFTPLPLHTFSLLDTEYFCYLDARVGSCSIVYCPQVSRKVAKLNYRALKACETWLQCEEGMRVGNSSLEK